jgi:hypothetical protein
MTKPKKPSKAEAWDSALDEVFEAIDHVARANWPGRDTDAKQMAQLAFKKLRKRFIVRRILSTPERPNAS